MTSTIVSLPPLIGRRPALAALAVGLGLVCLPGAALRAAETAPSAVITAEGLRDRLARADGRDGLVLIDIRDDAAIAKGHIPGSVAADYRKAGWRTQRPGAAGGLLPPVARIEDVIGSQGVSNASEVVIVSDDFGAAARVHWTFRVLGHDRVQLLDGGYPAWAALQGAEIATGSPAKPLPGLFVATYRPELRAEADLITARLSDKLATLVDARPAEQFSGLDKAPTVARYGHLPGAVNIDQARALTPDGKLRTLTELRALFADLSDDAETITYCNTGHWAAADWFVLSEVLHRPNVKMYDGSMSDWAAEPSRPMVATAAPRPAPPAPATTPQPSVTR